MSLLYLRTDTVPDPKNGICVNGLPRSAGNGRRPLKRVEAPDLGTPDMVARARR